MGKAPPRSASNSRLFREVLDLVPVAGKPEWLLAPREPSRRKKGWKTGSVPSAETTQSRPVLSQSPWRSSPWSRLGPDSCCGSAGARPSHRKEYAPKAPGVRLMRRDVSSESGGPNSLLVYNGQQWHIPDRHFGGTARRPCFAIAAAAGVVGERARKIGNSTQTKGARPLFFPLGPPDQMPGPANS